MAIFDEAIGYISAVLFTLIRVSKIYGLLKFGDVERSNYLPTAINIVANIFFTYYSLYKHATPLLITGLIDIVLDIIVIILTEYNMRKKGYEFHVKDLCIMSNNKHININDIENK